jgi:hypothetical protein
VEGNVMNQILAQLEEADHILMLRAGLDMEVKKPILPSGVQPSVNLLEVKREKLTLTSGCTDGGVNKKPEHDCPDPLPYVWSM